VYHEKVDQGRATGHVNRFAMTRNWIVCCGALRELIDFKMTLATLVDLRNQGLAEAVVLSTWRGEVERNPGLREKLDQLGVITVESDDPPHPGPSNFWRQLKSFYCGFKVCPKEVNILKARTDKIMQFLGPFSRALEKGPEPVIPHGDLKLPFRRKIRVPHTFSTVPISFLDMMFYGRQADLAKVAHFDGFTQNCAIAPKLDPSFAWISRPFMDLHPIFMEFMETYNVRHVSNALLLYARSGETRQIPKYLAKVFALNLVLVRSCITLPFSRGEAEDISFYDLFGRRGMIHGISSPARVGYKKVTLKADSYVEAAVTGALESSHDYKRFLKWIEKFKEVVRVNRCLDERSKAEVDAFIARYGDEKDFVRPLTVIRPSASETGKARGSFEDVLDFLDLADGMEGDRKEKKVINEVLQQSIENRKKTEWAFFRIGQFYWDGRGGLKKDRMKAMAWFRRSADRKFPEAQFMWGRILFEGELIEKDRGQGLKYMVGAAYGGNVNDAKFYLAQLHMRGDGLKKDRERAKTLLKGASMNGHKEAKRYLHQHFSKNRNP
jgi:hypothetical protein